MAKVDYERTPDGYQRILDGNLKIEKALFIPVFTGSPDLNDNTDEAGAIGINTDLVMIFYDGSAWQTVALNSALSAEIAARITADNLKVDKVMGFGLSSNDYTSAEKTKLSNLSEHYIGVYATSAALTAANPTGIDGQYATVETTGVPAVTYVWDSLSNTWVAGGTGSVTSVNSKTGAVSLSTDDIGEGSTNEYFTTTRVLATALAGFTSGSGTISSSDTILQAIQKLNGNIAAIPAGAWGSITGTLSAQTDLSAALAALAPLASPAFTGSPTAPTQSGTDNSTKLATTAFVQSAVVLSNSSYKISYNFYQTTL
jgi:hypothetical protein